MRMSEIYSLLGQEVNDIDSDLLILLRSYRDKLELHNGEFIAWENEKDKKVYAKFISYENVDNGTVKISISYDETKNETIAEDSRLYIFSKMHW